MPADDVRSQTRFCHAVGPTRALIGHAGWVALLLALASALAYGTGDYAGGRATRAVPLLVVSLITQTVSTALALLVVVVDRAPFPGVDDVGWSVAAGLASLVGFLSFYRALSQGAMTVVAPLTAVVSAVVPVGVGIATGERPSTLALVGVLVALVAVALVSGLGARLGESPSRRIVGLALTAGIAFGLLFVFLDRTSESSGFWPLGIGQSTCWLLIVTIFLARSTTIGMPTRSHALAAGAGGCNLIANVAYLLATREGLLSLVAVTASMYPATTVALATVVDGERMSGRQITGVVLAVAAVAMVGVGG